MPKLYGFREVKFVPFDWSGDERGYVHEVVDDPIVYAHYKEEFARALVRARDNVKLCGELGVLASQYGMDLKVCERSVSALEATCYAPERPKLVRITLRHA